MPELLTSQKADLFEVIRQTGMNPTDFTLKAHNDHHGDIVGNVVLHIRTNFFCNISVSGRVFRLAYSPGAETMHGGANAGGWAVALKEYTAWISNIQREVSATDPWAGLSKYSALVPIEPDETERNSALTPPEINGIWKALTLIQERLLIDAGDNTDHRRLVETQLAYLAEGSKTMGRKDWLMIAIGTLTTIATAMSVTPETATAVFLLLKAAVSGTIRLMGR